jgi:hypothetical protein
VHVTADGGVDVTRYGSTFVVAQDGGPLGPGWSLSVLDRLYDVPALEAAEGWAPSRPASCASSAAAPGASTPPSRAGATSPARPATSAPC